MSDHNYINTRYKLVSLYHEDSLSSFLELVRKRSCLMKGRVTFQFPTHTFTLRLWEHENFTYVWKKVYRLFLKKLRGYSECRKKRYCLALFHEAYVQNYET